MLLATEYCTNRVKPIHTRALWLLNQLTPLINMGIIYCLGVLRDHIVLSLTEIKYFYLLGFCLACSSFFLVFFSSDILLIRIYYSLMTEFNIWLQLQAWVYHLFLLHVICPQGIHPPLLLTVGNIQVWFLYLALVLLLWWWLLYVLSSFVNASLIKDLWKHLQ